MSANFNPNLNTYSNVQPFRFWCQKVLPLVYDDSLSYYELLAKVVKYLNNMLSDLNLMESDIEALHTAYAQLETYVNEYFDNLDVQAEINNKIDEMAENGFFDDILTPLFNEYTASVNATISDMQDTIDVLDARMDTFASLPDGSTTADAELIDIRVEADGTVAATAGDAVRAQVTNLKNAINAISGETRNLADVSAFQTGAISVNDGVVTGTAGTFASLFYQSGVPFDIEWEANTQYTVSFDAKNDTGAVSTPGLVVGFKYTDETSTQRSIPNNVTEYTECTLTSESGKTVSYIYMGYSNQGAYVWSIKDFQIEKGTSATDYIQHISAVDYVARETGSNAASDIAAIQSKTADIVADLSDYNCCNIFSPSLSNTLNSLTCTGGDGYIILNGTASQMTYFDVLTITDFLTSGFEVGEDYWFDTGLKSLSNYGKYVIYANVGSGYAKIYDNLIGVNRIHIPAACTNLLIRFYPAVGITFNNKKIPTTISKNLPNYLLHPSAEVRFLRAFGTGDATIIKFSNGEILVIDFGLNEPQGELQASWSAAISELGITHIDYAIISHFHKDHVGMLEYGISNLLDSETVFFLPNQGPFTAAELEALAWVDAQTGDTIVDNYEMAMSAIETAGCQVVYPTENDVWKIGGSEVRFWNTNHSAYMAEFEAHTAYDYNACSLCNYITIGAERMCFSGDINVAVMTAYQKSVLPSQIFKVNHHSNGYPVVNMFLNSLMPEVDVSMLGHNLAIATLASNPNQLWCEANFVPNVVTGINQKTLSMKVNDADYVWNTSCRRCIAADEGLT